MRNQLFLLLIALTSSSLANAEILADSPTKIEIGVIPDDSSNSTLQYRHPAQVVRVSYKSAPHGQAAGVEVTVYDEDFGSEANNQNPYMVEDFPVPGLTYRRDRGYIYQMEDGSTATCATVALTAAQARTTGACSVSAIEEKVTSSEGISFFQTAIYFSVR